MIGKLEEPLSKQLHFYWGDDKIACDFFFKERFPGGSEVKAPACNTAALGSIPRLGRSPGEGNGNPLQYSCLENPMDRGAC